jgi:hypothetical protein
MGSMTKESLPTPRRPASRAAARCGAAILVAGGIALLGACSSGGSNSGGTASPATTSPMTHSASPSTTVSVSAATCKHVSSLRTSLENLTHLSLSASASAQIRKDLTNIQTQLGEIRASGNGAFSAQVNSLSMSLDQVEKASKNLSSPPTGPQVQKIISALGALKSNSKTTVAAMSSACPT